jgi:hypothetical protein
LFSAVWALTQYRSTAPVFMFVVLAVALVIPGWVAWVALHAQASHLVIACAVAAIVSGPMIQLIFVGGGRLTRALIYGWIGFGFLVSIVVALQIMRRARSVGLIAGPVLGANALVLAMLPLSWLLTVRFG